MKRSRGLGWRGARGSEPSACCAAIRYRGDLGTTRCPRNGKKCLRTQLRQQTRSIGERAAREKTAFAGAAHTVRLAPVYGGDSALGAVLRAETSPQRPTSE